MNVSVAIQAKSGRKSKRISFKNELERFAVCFIFVNQQKMCEEIRQELRYLQDEPKN